MRFLIFLSLISISYGHAWAGLVIVASATTTPAGVTVTSFLSAQQTCTATLTPSVPSATLVSNLTEAVTISSNALAGGVVFNAGCTLSDTGSLPIVRVNSGPSLPTTFTNSTTSCTSNNFSFSIAGISAGGGFWLEGGTVLNSGSSGAGINESAVLLSAGQCGANRVVFNSTGSTGSSCIRNAGLNTIAHALKFTNCILTDAIGTGYLDATAVSSNDVIDWDHDTFSGCATAYVGKSGEAVTNCLSVNNTVETSLTSPAAGSDFVNFQSNGALTGCVNCITGATLANVYSDRNKGYKGSQNPGFSSGVSTGLIGQPALNGIIWTLGLNSPGAMCYTGAWDAGKGEGR